jgi:hypothetical protein
LSPPLSLRVLPDALAVCRLSPSDPVPAWALASPFSSATRTEKELSIVCREALVPEDVRAERGWRAFELEGAFDFSLTGVLASLLEPLARAGVSIVAISTYDTDYVLVRAETLSRAVAALRGAAHRVVESDKL